MSDSKPTAVDEASHIEHHDDQKVAVNLQAEEVKGRDFTTEISNLPKGYFRSLTFLGSMLAIGMSFSCGVGGFSFAAPVLAYINADIGVRQS